MGPLFYWLQGLPYSENCVANPLRKYVHWPLVFAEIQLSPELRMSQNLCRYRDSSFLSSSQNFLGGKVSKLRAFFSLALLAKASGGQSQTKFLGSQPRQSICPWCKVPSENWQVPRLMLLRVPCFGMALCLGQVTFSFWVSIAPFARWACWNNWSFWDINPYFRSLREKVKKAHALGKVLCNPAAQYPSQPSNGFRIQRSWRFFIAKGGKVRILLSKLPSARGTIMPWHNHWSANWSHYWLVNLRLQNYLLAN